MNKGKGEMETALVNVVSVGGQRGRRESCMETRERIPEESAESLSKYSLFKVTQVKRFDYKGPCENSPLLTL